MRCSSTLLLSLFAFSPLACKQKPAPPPAPLSHGAELYTTMCAVCHGANGEGYKADQAPRLAQPDFQASVTDAYLREAIQNGRQGTTMSAWATTRGGPLSNDDVAALIKFMRDSWGKAPRQQLDERPLSGDIARGENTFARECVRCHGTKGVGGPNLHIGNPQLLQTATNGYLRYAIKNGRPGTQMPSFAGTLGDAGIEDVTALLRNWASPPPPPPAPAPPPPLPLGPVPLNPHGPDPVGFKATPATTPADVIHAELKRGARMALLDARTPSDYMNEHIAGAVSVPFYNPTDYFAKLPKNAWLVCYCACPHAESGTLAGKLVAAGFKKVTVLDEGLGFWRGKKYETHTGEKP
ncbi:MAG TPA: c-type cytochrome [Polyangiaceae bacterium]|jgi:cytochrome c oxidase cbb3-type subunit 3/ubiquinol-cytochrome c reductase cytochrome c subunit|nr:c-type cytochrome [Polyangiaceae bacterium]